MRSTRCRVAPEGTVFKQLVWKALREVRAGSTISYGELAAQVGAPGAARAVGTANATNPICLVIPCHRVIRSGGDIGNYGVRPRPQALAARTRSQARRVVRDLGRRDQHAGPGSGCAADGSHEERAESTPVRDHPLTYTRCLPALVAQWIEHLTTDQKVGGSTPSERAAEVQVTAVCGS